MESTEHCTHPLTRQDAAAVIGVLAVLEGEIAGGNVDAQVVDHLRRRLADDGLPSGGEDLGPTLEAIAQRVRYALGG